MTEKPTYRTVVTWYWYSEQQAAILKERNRELLCKPNRLRSFTTIRYKTVRRHS